MKKIKNEFSSEREKQQYIDLCEADFEADLDRVCAAVTENKVVRYLLISGPSCACKSTVVKKLAQDEVSAGRRIYIISIDDFFLSRTEDRDFALASGEKLDFDSVDAMDLPLFRHCVEGIFRGERVMLPHFDFKSAVRSHFTEFDPGETDIIIFEGIQAVYPEITEIFRDMPYMSIYIDVEGPIEAAGEVFTGRQLRLLRRLVRDARFRNASPSFTMYMWQSVTENEDKSMAPYSHLSHVHLDSFIPYELGVLKEPLTSLISGVLPEEPYYRELNEILKRFEGITPINSDYLPKDSMYREFLG